jgi:phosphoenolpyruvate carboxylase
MGLPPELLGLHSLDEKDLRDISLLYPSPNFEEDLRDALSYFNPKCLSLLRPDMRKQIEKAVAIIDYEPNGEHMEITSQIIDCMERTQTDHIGEMVIRAAKVRRFLG